MARRSDHTRDELLDLIVKEAHSQLREGGLRAFSARSVAKAIGYSVGTIHNLFGSVDALLIQVNTCTFRNWTAHVREQLAHAPTDRIGAMVDAYFGFAIENPNLWMAIYDHRLPTGMTMPEHDAMERFKLTDLVTSEVAAWLDRDETLEVVELTRSLIATVHGHCSLAINGSYTAMGGSQPLLQARDRVREALDAAIRKAPASGVRSVASS